jgi:hypothetical protein
MLVPKLFAAPDADAAIRFKLVWLCRENGSATAEDEANPRVTAFPENGVRPAAAPAAEAAPSK